MNKQRDQIAKEAMQYRVDLIAYARAFVGDYSTAEDIVQQAFLVIFDKYQQFQKGTSVLAWSRAIVRIEVLRLRGRRHRERTLSASLLEAALTLLLILKVRVG